MGSLPYGYSPHRKKNARKCDRCPRRAAWNYRPEVGPILYVCQEHRED